MKKNLLSKSYFILNTRLKKFFLYFLIFTFIAVFFEVLSLAIVIPIFGLIQDPEKSNLLNHILQHSKVIKENLIPFSALILIFVFSIKTLYMIYYSKYKSNFIFRIERELSTETLSIYLNKSFENFKQINSAFIARDILGEMSIFRNFLIAISLLIVEILDVVGILFIMFYTNFYSTLASIIFIITTSSLIIIYIRKKTTFIGKRRQKIEGLRLKETNLILQNYKYIKVNQLEIKSLERAYKLNNELSIILSINDFLKNAPKYILEFLGIASVMIYVLITFYTIGKQNLFENITPLIIFLYGSIKLMPSANRILSSINTVTFSKTTVNKLYDLFYNRPPELLSNNISFNKSITFDKVSFKYRDSDIYIYKDFSHLILKNDFVGIIGASGNGKSTLVNLFLGLLKPTSGNIYIDNIILNDENLSSFRKQIAYIPQDFILLDETIIDNISYFDDKVDRSRLIQIINDLALIDIYNRLQNSNDNKIGENGNKLSGGQRQRIALARAIYKNASILVLDEPFSALDELATIELVNILNKIRKNITIITITHTQPDNLKFSNVINL